LQTSNTETIGSITRNSTISYDYLTAYHQLDPIATKTETDPLGKATKTYYHAPFDLQQYLVFKSAAFPVIPAYTGETSSLDSVYLYLIYQPDSVIVKNGSTRLAKQSFEYYNPTSV